MAGAQHWGEFVATPLPTATVTHAPSNPTLTPKLKSVPSQPPDLVQIGSAAGEERQEHEFGVGPIDFVHSLQLQIFLKRAASGQPTPLPTLKQPAAKIASTVINLSLNDVMKLIRRAVVLCCVDCGYERASQSCLNLLSESCGRFIQQICGELSSHRVSQRWTSTRNEEEYLYQLLDEIGSPVASLHHFVKSTSERKNERLLRVNRLYGPVADHSAKPVKVNEQTSSICTMIAGLEGEAPPAAENEMWDCSLEEMSQMTDNEIMKTLLTYEK